jgi:hypothetical protein
MAVPNNRHISQYSHAFGHNTAAVYRLLLRSDIREIQNTKTTLMMEEERTSEMSVSLYQTTRRNNPEDSHHKKCGPEDSLTLTYTLSSHLLNGPTNVSSTSSSKCNLADTIKACIETRIKWLGFWAPKCTINALAQMCVCVY